MSPGRHGVSRGPQRGRARVTLARRCIPKRWAAVFFVFALTIGVAWAYWSAGSVPGGNGASAATSANGGATPTATSNGTAVTVSWAATTLADGTAVHGYSVKRYDVATLTAQTMLSACSGVLGPTTCIESSVPAGQWVYSVTPVFAVNWTGAESAKSSTVTVSQPANAITMSVVSGGAYKSGNTIYYRGGSLGSFTLTNAVSGGTGAASSATAALGETTTGWTHTPSTVSTPSGGPYVSASFSWTAGSTSAPSEVVTGRDTGTGYLDTTLSFVNDSTAPSAGTVTYTDGYQAGRSVDVTFTTGTDSGSGLGARQLQRSWAPLTSGSCGGTYSSFANLGSANPTSPYTDSLVTNGICYKYRYLVTDLVGNQDIATSANVAMVDYAGSVNTTTGLLSQWRLGEGAATLTSSDSFTGTSATNLTSHTSDTGATWQYEAGTTSFERISNANRLRGGGSFGGSTGYSINNTTATPPSADYSVEADLVVKSNLTADMAGVIGRLTTGSSRTFYMARYEQAGTRWNLVRYSSGSPISLGTSTQSLTAGQTYRVRLSMIGDQIRLYVNGVLTVGPITDATPLSAVKAGIMDGNTSSSPAKSDSTGIHFDNFQVTPSTYPRAADSKGSNTGDYVNGPTLGVAGALTGDANTAASLNGVNDYVQAVGTTGIPVGASLRSVEMWFKTSSAARQVLFAYGTLANTQEFGLWLNAGGASMTAWGTSGTSTDNKTFTLASAVNNGAWHQVVKTYDGTSITLYIDGVALTPQAATRATVMDSYGFGIGAIVNSLDATNSGGYFNGSLDEVSFYTTALDQATVTNHYQLGTSPAPDVTGPTGGSVAASGLVGTGSAYAASTTLSLNLATGTDPSGVATTGNLLQRATATLTSSGGTSNGSCGSYGAYALVSGGTDPGTPMSDTVADQACYSYRYVVVDTLGNSTTYTSAAIKVDTTAPAAPSLTFSNFSGNNTYWNGSGSTVFYRSAAASGSFRATASATDAASGILSSGYGFPTSLGTNWSTSGTSTQRTYSWSGAPEAPGTSSVTATNNATLISAGAPFTLTADDTAPTAGTVTYADGTTADTSVSVSFTAGTDAGSGVATGLLQRASAPLTGGVTCGTYTAYTTVVNGTNPTSPFVEEVSGGTCYQYQYVVPDNVGNADTATSTNVIKVTILSYFNTISGTGGLLSYWRLGETTTSSDSFTGTAAATLQSRAGETGATWTKHTLSGATDSVITATGRIRKNGTTAGALYYSSGVPSSADYMVEADVYRATSVGNDMIGVVGRLDPAVSTGTFYSAVYDRANSRWALYSTTTGTKTLLGFYGQTLSTLTYRLALDMNGSTIRLLVDGVERVSVVNTAITAAGSGGVTMGFGAASTTVTDSLGMHLDNYQVGSPTTPRAADSWGTNIGDYFNGPNLGVAGAIAGDSNTAATFNGSNDYASVTRQISDDFSIEFWFKSTQGFAASSNWYNDAGLVDAYVSNTSNDFGVSLRSDGLVVAGVGSGGTNNSIRSTSSYIDGAWHHVVFTRTRSSGALVLYVDGASAATGTGSTASLTSPANINFGRIQSGTNYFLGSLDEVAVYNTVLSGPMVTTHYNAAQ